MNPVSRMTVIRTIFERLAREGTAELLLAYVAPNATLRTTAPAGTALDERFIGPAGVGEYLRRVDALMLVDRIRVHDYFERDDRFVVIGDQRLSLRAGGQPRTTAWAAVVTFLGVSIVEVCIIEDLSILCTLPLAPMTAHRRYA
jgi:hypothetical protein